MILFSYISVFKFTQLYSKRLGCVVKDNEVVLQNSDSSSIL
jgi:hypothetical protein